MNKKIIICKFNLKNKCKFGEKCKFRHLNIDELNDILNKFEELKQEIESLQKNLTEKCEKLSNFDKSFCDVTSINVNALSKPLIIAFPSEKKVTVSLKLKQFKKIKLK